MEELISVIVPVYQVKAYLPECVESLLGQTYKNLEIILVDDGSTDGSGELCEEYAKRDGRVRVVHQKNRGLSGARNTGLQSARGEYIAFVDSDDVVSELFVESLYALLKRQKADIAVCSYEKSKTGVLRQSKGEREYSISSKKMLEEWHGERKAIETVVWNKLYHKSVFEKEGNNIWFPEGKEHEDVYVSHLLVKNAERIAITDCKLYMYRIRKGSITGSKVTEAKIRQDLEAQLARVEFFEKMGYGGSRDRVVIGMLLHIVLYRYKLRMELKEKKYEDKKGKDCKNTKELKKEMRELFELYYPQIAESQELNGIFRIILKGMRKWNE